MLHDISLWIAQQDSLPWRVVKFICALTVFVGGMFIIGAMLAQRTKDAPGG